MGTPSDSAPIRYHLKRGLERAVDSYQTFQQSEIPTDAKGFTAYHQACKAALTHIALLLKMIPSENPDGLPQTDWVALARDALQSREDEDDSLFAD